MARPIKKTVDLFPHATQTGKTVAILEAYWGNDGYAFWFKVLELLGGSAGFFYHCNKPENWEYLLAKTRVTEKTAVAILDKLAELDAIDAELWENGIIWSDHFVDNLAPVFAAIDAVAAGATDYEDFNAGLEALAATLPVDRLARRLLIGMMIGRIRGEEGLD